MRIKVLRNILQVSKSARAERSKKLQLQHDAELVRDKFDRNFYLDQNEDVRESGVDPLLHYLEFGWHEMRDPNPDFSTLIYLSSNPEIRAAGINPLVHYVSARNETVRRSHLPEPTFDREDRSDLEVDIWTADVKPHFDADYYLQNNEDVAETGMDALQHYMFYGWHEGRDPSPHFSTRSYLESNPDVAAQKINPYWHYIVAGRDEGRMPTQERSDEVTGVNEADDVVSFKTDIETIRAHFDSEFYLSQHPDLQGVDVDLVEHYFINGWKEGRNPCATFSTRHYLDTNPDVADLGINPFWHYIVAGRHEGRAALHPGGYRVERLSNMIPLEQQVALWRPRQLAESLLKKKEIIKLLSPTSDLHHKTFILSVGHDNYHEVSGGVQLCEYREELLSKTTQALYVGLHPWRPLQRLAKEDEDSDPVMSLLVDGETVGQCRISDLISVVASMRPEYQEMQVVIHQMLGHLPERLIELVKATGRNDCWFWLHDFFSVCPSFTLQRNGISYCGAPPVDSNSCELCLYGEERRSHIERMKDFFEKVQVHVLSPSQVAADIWENRFGLAPASLQVLPHMKLRWRKRTTPPPTERDEITVAFLGTPAPHKGWAVFETLVHQLKKDGRYRLLFLGSDYVALADIEQIKVHVTANEPDAMIDAVNRAGVDLVLHWASWPETFSLSTYEALAGGAYVLTNKGSGNVAVTVKRLKRGTILEGEDDLMQFFTDGRVDKMVSTLRAERRQKQVHHRLSRMVHDAIDTVAESEADQ